ncbi:MAG: glycine zipper 2TM domain-containing protein [Methylobacter sp.]
MKKSLFLTHLLAFAIIYSSASYASGGEGRGHGRGHHKHHHSEEARYYPEQPRYAPPQDPRSHQGLAGGVVGSVLGYEIGNGNPIATGVGAAAGSYLGNGIAGKR